MLIKYVSCSKTLLSFYPQVVLLNCVWIFTLPPLLPTSPFPLFQSLYVVQYAHGSQNQTPHLPLSLAAKSPSRDLLKWNIRFHFEVLKLLNHLARKDAARVVKLLCLAAGSPSADRTQGIRETSSGTRHLTTRHWCHWNLLAAVFLFSVEIWWGVTEGDEVRLSGGGAFLSHCL